MSEQAFQFAVLRYVHDPATQEFLNVGVVVYSREGRYLRSALSRHYRRLSEAFQGIEGEQHRRVMDYLARRVEAVESDLQPRLFGQLPETIEEVLWQVLPPDDASLVFGGFGGGLTCDLEAELGYLFDRMVTRYARPIEPPSRTDGDIWRVYRAEFEKRRIHDHLQSKTIRTATYHYDFEHAWKNEKWNPVEPVSFDLVHERSILDKANRWIGASANLRDSAEMGTLYMLVGGPREDGLQRAYEDALHNLSAKLLVDHRIVEEAQAAGFSHELADIIETHAVTE